VAKEQDTELISEGKLRKKEKGNLLFLGESETVYVLATRAGVRQKTTLTRRLTGGSMGKKKGGGQSSISMVAALGPPTTTLGKFLSVGESPGKDSLTKERAQEKKNRERGLQQPN